MVENIQTFPKAVEKSPRSSGIRRVLNAALAAVDPEKAVGAAVRWDGQNLTWADGSIPIADTARVVVVSFGKAAIPMARGLVQVLGKRITSGVALTKVIPRSTGLEDGPFKVCQGGHPVPDESSIRGTEKILRAIQGLHEEDLVICLISGGGSALLTKPLEGISLADIQRLTAQLLRSGASIDEMNVLRKHLDQVKGGRLASLAAPARVLTLVLSDVVGNPLATIASGPTVPDPSSYADALGILERYALIDQAPAAIVGTLEGGRVGEIPETLKAGDPFTTRISTLLVGSNRTAAQAALRQAEAEGYHALLLTTFLQGEASQAGRFLTAIARQVAESDEPLPRPACLIAGGETTVTIRGDGRGGRNLELALGAVTGMAGIERALLISLATDGEDGSAPAAGAAVDGDTLDRARSQVMNPDDFLTRNDSYPFFEKLGDVLVTGSTGTNVNDLAFLFLD